MNIATSDFTMNVSKYMKAALKKPVIIAKHGVPTNVLMSIDEYMGDKPVKKGKSIKRKSKI